MRTPLSLAAQDLDLMPDPNDQMEEAKRLRRKETGDASQSPEDDEKTVKSQAALDLLAGWR